MIRFAPFVLCFLFVFYTSLHAAEEKVAVRIDDDIVITSNELDEFLDARLRGGGAPEAQMKELRAQFWDKAMEQFIMQKLLLRASDKAGVTLDKGEVQGFFDKNLPAGMSPQEAAESEGMSEIKFVTMIGEGIRIQKHLENMTESVAAPTEEELRAAFDERIADNPSYAEIPESVEARHILIKTDGDADASARTAARDKLVEIRRKIVEDGADFSLMAAEFSDCPSGKRDGGSLGSFRRGQMVKPFEDAAFTQEPAVVGEVIETDFGYHIVEVISKTEAGKRSFETERDLLQESMTREKKSKLVESYIEQLKKDAKIDVLMPEPVASSD